MSQGTSRAEIVPDFLIGGGAMGALMRVHDWSASPLGRLDLWPQPLKTIIGVVLASSQAMFVVWGPERTLLYNDAYAEMLGDKHPQALGRPFLAVWPEMHDALLPIIEQAFAGTPVRIDDMMLPVRRNGCCKETHVAFSYTPVRDESGAVAGFFCPCTEITRHVLAERDARACEARTRRALEGMGEAFVLLDHNLRVVDINSEALRLDQRPREALVGRTHWEAWPGSESSELGRCYKHAMAERVPVSLEHRYVWPDGHAAWLEMRAYPTGDGLALFYRDVTERKHAQEVLQAKEMRLRLAIEAGQIGEWEWDVATQNSVRAPRHDQIFGYDDPLPEWGFDTFISHVVPEDRDHVAAAFRTAAEEGTGWHFECRIRRANDGAVRWIAAHSEPQIGSDGRVLRLFGMVQDITEQRRAQEQLRRAEARLRLALDAAGMAVWEYDLATDTIGGSPELNRLLGLAEDHHFDTAEFRTGYYPGDEVRIREAAEAAVARGEQHFEVAFRHRGVGGAMRWLMLRARIVLGRDGKRERVTGVIADVTAQKDTEERLQESEATLRAFFETADLYQAVVELQDNDFCFVTANRQMAHILGQDSLASRFGSEVFAPEMLGPMLARLREGYAAGHPTTVEYPSHVSGDLRWFVATLSPMPAAASGNPRISIASLDITDRKRAEAELKRVNETLAQKISEALAEREQAQEALRQSQKLEAIGQLTGGVAHDFNNLLTVIRSSADLLRRSDLAESRRQRYVEAIAETADRAAKLTSQLLAFARRQVLKPEVFEVGNRIDALREMLRTVVGSRVQIVTEICRETCYTKADVNQFETAIINMAVNARDAMDGEGKLTITVDVKAHIPRTRNHAAADGDFVSVAISDTGTGIAPENLSRIFDPFFTTKEVGKGTGLGLSQVFGFAKQSGGEVTVDSISGTGTTLTLYLPRVDAPCPAPSLPEATVEPAACHGHVLVVEDNEQVGSFSTQLLAELGYQTSWAPNADAALKLLGSDPRRYAAVFSDVVMPGMNGVDLGREIRRRWPGIPVVLTSGYSHVLAEEGRHGFELLHKPYSVEELTQVLRRAIHKE